MPLVRISLLKGKPPEYLRAVADGVHAALAETYTVPPDDRFQLIDQYEPGAFIYDPDYLGVHRTDDLVMVQITAAATRDTATKQALYKAIVARLTRDPGLRPEDVMITIIPNQREDWSFGHGLASYVKD
ncbi:MULTISPECIES: tautomerase family protein [unclassified Caulobacter]|jgi:phenylpyruvate tautomerase PptA (4-oxalocrotonate tautomerase family)|uniref:tautomerase family protein n=1 Tax=unclassified Caulobacter TaxID=2648921 RepID=UPI0006F4FED5|nr:MULTISPECIES: tautomerase family protein [unclassified Caulobacter]KQV55891.1 decarboxylase [Caulobacter sp. Root342]KQV70935.1 decarboxylase [Caulobacter sp. Root343]